MKKITGYAQWIENSIKIVEAYKYYVVSKQHMHLTILLLFMLMYSVCC